mgnify:CR=1 FL=1
MKKALIGAIITLSLMPVAAFAAEKPAKASCTMTASDTSIKPGESVTISWSTENSSLRVGSFGLMAQSGSVTVSPKFTTDYYIDAIGLNSSKHCHVVVRVK